MTSIKRPGGECLHFRDPSWCVIYKVNGVRKLKSLHTADLAEARIRRDAFFLEHGAAAPERPSYVYRRKPFYVRHPDGLRGDFETEEEAMRAVREFERTRP
jgi:hypothetical protein